MGSLILLILVFFPILTSFAIFSIQRCSRSACDWCVRIVTGIELVCAILLLFMPSSVTLPGICGFGLNFTAGSLRSLLAVVTAFMWAMTGLSCKEYFALSETRSRFYFFYLMTLGALMGTFLAFDLYTLFIFFEIMSVVSYTWVTHNETPQAIRAGNTFLAFAVIGGMSLLVGVLLLYHLLGTLQISALSAQAIKLSPEMRPELIMAGVFCFIGFGSKAGVFPLHVWMAKAYPVAPAPSSALLSGILSKAGIFGILIISCNLFFNYADWNMVVLVLALINMVMGAVLAIFSVDLKRTLAGSSMSQIGFILLGVAMQGFLSHENALAAWGTVLHMLNHSLVKLVLFVGAGVIYKGANSLDLSEIRGWGLDKPWLKATFLIGAASMCGIPLFPGYISKTLLHESIVEYIHLLHGGASSGLFHAVEWLFLISGGLTVAYMTKIFVAVFVEHPAERLCPSKNHNYISKATQVALGFSSLVIVILGLTPSLTMEKISVFAVKFLHAGTLEEPFHYFSLTNLEGAAISLAIGAAVYFLIVRNLLRKEMGAKITYPNRWPSILDLEELVYRPMIRGLSFCGALCARLAASVGDLITIIGEKLLFLRAPGIIVPKMNDNFGCYSKKPRCTVVTQAFSFDLMVTGLGLIAMLVYILLI